MAFDSEQVGILRGSALSVAFAFATVGAGYAWLAAGWFGLTNAMTMADQIDFTLKAELLLFAWPVVRPRSQQTHFRSAVDRNGLAFGRPSEAIAIPAAVLQNSLEQTALAFGAHLVLTTVLRGPELVMITLLIALYIFGRVTSSRDHAQGAAQRSFGMALTAAPTVASCLLAAGLMITGW